MSGLRLNMVSPGQLLFCCLTSVLLASYADASTHRRVVVSMTDESILLS